MSEQSFLGSTLLTLNRDGARKRCSKNRLLHLNLSGKPRPGGSPTSGRNKEKLSRTDIMKFGTWNVRTLMDNPNSDRPERRTAFIARGFCKLNFGIVALRDGPIERTPRFIRILLKRADPEQSRSHSVGFAIRNSLLPKLTEQPVGFNERLMTLCIQLVKNQHSTIISAYAPTLDSYDIEKGTFYAQLDSLLYSVPKEDKILLGDFYLETSMPES